MGGRLFRTGFARALAAGVASALGACAAPSSYYGIDVAGVDAWRPVCEQAGAQCYPNLPLPQLARLAQSNDKYAQLELGIRFEDGLGVEQNLRIAERLYLEASTSIGGKATYFAPSSREGVRGRVKTTATAVMVAGLPEARSRLMALQQGKCGKCDAGY